MAEKKQKSSQSAIIEMAGVSTNPNQNPLSPEEAKSPEFATPGPLPTGTPGQDDPETSAAAARELKSYSEGNNESKSSEKATPRSEAGNVSAPSSSSSSSTAARRALVTTDSMEDRAAKTVLSAVSRQQQQQQQQELQQSKASGLQNEEEPSPRRRLFKSTAV